MFFITGMSISIDQITKPSVTAPPSIIFEPKKEIIIYDLINAALIQYISDLLLFFNNSIVKV